MIIRFKTFVKKTFFTPRPTLKIIDNYLIGEVSIVPTNLNYKKFTELCLIMKKNGSDKGCFVGMSKHNYTVLYYHLFKNLREQKIRLFELGIGTTNTSFSANMGADGSPGASLRGWREFFSKALIYSADIDREVLFEDTRISTYYCDQTNPQLISEMWNEPSLDTDFTVILDDGYHDYFANVCFFENSSHKLVQNGIYIIEDVWESQIKNWEVYIKNAIVTFPNFRFSIVQIPNKYNLKDNNLIVVHKIKD